MSIDYTQFTEKKKDKPVKSKKQTASGIRWWLSSDEELSQAIWTQVTSIIQADRGRIVAYNTYAKLYGTWVPTFYNGYSLASSGKPVAPMRERLTYNIVQSCIDTLTARISQNKPKPMFLTNGGNSKLQRKAKKLDAFEYGIFYENDFYQEAPKIFRDACIYGEGIIHSFAQDGRVKHERVFPYEILVDYLESHYGPRSTRSLFRIKNIDRTELMEMYPDQADKIMLMTNTGFYLTAASRSVADTVTVVEAWRVKVGSKVGRHCIVTENAILLDEDYKRDKFPFAIMRYSPRQYGFFAQGMAEQLVPLQVEINRTLISIQRSLYLGGTHKIFVKSGSKVIKSHFDNMIGTILEYAGDVAPQYVVPQLVQPEIYNHLENMIQKGYQLPGVSQLSASSLKPMGIDSGKALRAVDDIQVQRFQTIAQSYENLAVQVADNDIYVARDIYKDKGELEVKVPGKRFIETIDWGEVDMAEDEFMLQIYPVSKLPNDPEGRLATIQEMSGAGYIQPETARKLLDYPDLESEENLANSQLDWIHKCLDDMVDSGKYTAPEPFDNLTKGLELGLEYYAQGKNNNLAEDRLELIRTWISQVKMLTQTAMTPPPQAVTPPEAPMPTPQNQLIPNVNQPTQNVG